MIFLTGQRVILHGSEIGTIVRPEREDMPNTDKDMWVFSPSKNYASRYSTQNINPLPGGQL